MSEFVKDEDFDAFVGFVSQLQKSRPNEYGDDKLNDDKIRYLIDEFYKDNSPLKTQVVLDIIKDTDISSTKAGQIIDRILANDPVLGLSDEEVERAPYAIRETQGDVHDLLNDRFQTIFGKGRTIENATDDELFEFIKDKQAAYLVYASMQNTEYVPVIPKSNLQQEVEKELSLECFDFDALFNTFVSRYEELNGSEIATGLLYNMGKQQDILDQKTRLQVREYVISGERNFENDVAMLKKVKDANEEKFKQIFMEMFSNQELKQLENFGAENGVSALDETEQEKIKNIYKNNAKRLSNISFFEVASRLGLNANDVEENSKKNTKKSSKNIVEISKHIYDEAQFKEVVDYDYKLEADLIDPEQLRLNLVEDGEEKVLEPLVDRFVIGSQSITDYELDEDEKRDKIMMLARGLFGLDEILTSKLKEQEKAAKKAIEVFERTHTNIKFSALDLSEQNRYFAETFEDKASPEEVSSAEIEYITKLISSGTILNENGKKVGAGDVKKSQTIIQEIMDGKGSRSVDKFVVSETKLDFSVKKFTKNIDVLRAVISNMNEATFSNLMSQSKKGVTEADQLAREALERAKRQVIEQNYYKKLQIFEKNNSVTPVALDLMSKIPDVEKLSQIELKNFRFRISLLNRRVNDDQDSEILLNILRNCCFVNEDVMVKKMAEIQRIDSKLLKDMTTEDIKNELLPATVNKYFSENQQFKNIMLQTGANDITLALSKEQLAERELEEVCGDETFKDDVLEKLCGKNDKTSLSRAEKEYFYTDGKVRKDKLNEVFSAISSLKHDSLFAELLHDAVIEHVSYGTSDDEHAHFFKSSHANLPAPKNIAEAVKRGESVVVASKTFHKAFTQASSSLIKTDIAPKSRVREAQEIQREISIISNRVAEFNRGFKGGAREYSDSIQPILGNFAGIVYNEKGLASKLLGRSLATESTAVQQREIFNTLQIHMIKAAKRLEYISKYVPASGNFNDPKFIGGLTRAKSENERRQESARLAELENATLYIKNNMSRLSNILSYMQNSAFSKSLLANITRSSKYIKLSETEKVEVISNYFEKEMAKYKKIVSINNLGRRVDYGKFSDMRSRKVLHESSVPNKLQTELMRANSEYKALVEKLDVNHKEYIKIKEQIERVSAELDELLSPSTPKTDDVKRKIRDTRKVLSDLQVKFNIIEPSVQVTEEKIRKIELAHAEIYASKQIAGAKTRDVFDDYVLYGKNGVEINVTNNLSLKRQINDAINKFTSSMVSNIDRVNKQIALDKLDIPKFEFKSTYLSSVVKQASQIARTLNKQKTVLEAKLKTLDANDAEVKKISAVIDRIDANISRVKNDTKTLENVLGKAGVVEIKNKEDIVKQN